MKSILLLPGLACDGEVWKHAARRLSQVATVRIADYGSSDSIKKMAEAVLRRAPARFVVAGHSMGGRVAFEIVRRAPQRVTALALLDTAFRPFAGGAQGQREKEARLRLVDIARSQGMRAMAREWVQNMVHPSRLSDRALIESIVEMFARKSPETYARQIKALLERPDATPVLSSIRCPTIVLCGREDSWSTLETHKEIVARIRESKLIAIENCGHMAPMERPGEVTSAVVAWFCGLF